MLIQNVFAYKNILPICHWMNRPIFFDKSFHMFSLKQRDKYISEGIKLEPSSPRLLKLGLGFWTFSASRRLLKLGLGFWKFSASRQTDFWYFKYYVQSHLLGPTNFCWASTRTVISGSPGHNSNKNAKFCPWTVIYSILIHLPLLLFITLPVKFPWV